MPVAMIAETASLAARTVGKSASIVRTLGGSGSSRTVISIAMPNIPSLPTKRPTRSGPHGSPCGEPSRTIAGVGQHHLELDDVVGGDAVLETVRSAGILRHVAAHGAGGLARWVGHVVEADAGRPPR